MNGVWWKPKCKFEPTLSKLRVNHGYADHEINSNKYCSSAHVLPSFKIASLSKFSMWEGRSRSGVLAEFEGGSTSFLLSSMGLRSSTPPEMMSPEVMSDLGVAAAWNRTSPPSESKPMTVLLVGNKWGRSVVDLKWENKQNLTTPYLIGQSKAVCRLGLGLLAIP